MVKSIDVIKDSFRNNKHPFQRVENHPRKSQKHRYERRKIREYIRLGDWVSEEEV